MFGDFHLFRTLPHVLPTLAPAEVDACAAAADWTPPQASLAGPIGMAGLPSTLRDVRYFTCAGEAS